MKKRFAAVLAACLLLCCLPSSAAAMPEVSAKRACVIEVDSGLILEGKNENEKAEPASITKIMTALIALENYDKTKVITVPKKAAGVEGSSVYLKAGDKYTMEDLLYALMLRSGNDAATAIALTVGNGKVDNFVEMMNQKAKDLGCTNTHFNNPHGLPDPNHYTSAHDMALIAAEALRNEDFCQIVSTKSHKATERGTGEGHSWQNKNKLLWEYDGAIGVKTGYTKSAGKTYVGAAERNGVRIAVVVMGAADMWADAKLLLDDAFTRYQTVQLIQSGQSTGVCPVINGLTSEVEGITQGGIAKAMTEEEKSRVVTKCVYQTPLVAPIEQGQIIGSMQVYLDDTMLGSVPIEAKNAVETYSFQYCLKKIYEQWLRHDQP